MRTSEKPRPASTDLDPEAIARQVADTMNRVRANPYIPVEPSARQWAFLSLGVKEALYGGAAGGGKSYALLTAALEHVAVPTYRALLLRRTYQDLSLPDALMDLAKQWLMEVPEAKPVAGGREWEFDSGARLVFGHLDHEAHKYRYQGAAFHFVGFDELTQFTESQYRYLFSRLRRRSDIEAQGVPLRMRTATNPGGTGHEWVRSRFIVGMHHNRRFVPARLEDNPHLDQAAYRQQLAQLDPITRAQLEGGDWDIRPEGNFFKRSGFTPVGVDVFAHRPRPHTVRVWDLAATEGGGDYTAGARISWFDGVWRIEDMVRGQFGPDRLEEAIRETALRDGKAVPIVIEEEGGASGKVAMKDLRRRVLAGFSVHPARATGSKETRARLPSAAAANGDVEMVIGPWNGPWLDEATAFPEVAHDDQVDAVSHGFHFLAGRVGATGAHVPRGTVTEQAQKPKRLRSTQRSIVR